jgi:crossover junction endodeoxyribonuclease RuvC
MFVLGVDPGLSRCGYCVLSSAGNRPTALALGVIRTPVSAPVWERLAALQADVRDLLTEFPVDAVAIERVTFGANAPTASGVLQAAGVVMCEAVAAGASVAEYAPNQVKEAVTGWGAAPKDQVARMVASLLRIDAVPGPPDAADAAAVALCHLARAPMERLATSPTTGTPTTVASSTAGGRR